MAKGGRVVTLLYLMIVAAMVDPGRGDAIGDHRVGWVPTMRVGCSGSIEECMGMGEMGENMEMEMKMKRRILATSQYISYRALQRNTVPCSQKGASYYNCQPGAEANPYNRGCATITRCRTS